MVSKHTSRRLASGAILLIWIIVALMAVAAVTSLSEAAPGDPGEVEPIVQTFQLFGSFTPQEVVWEAEQFDPDAGELEMVIIRSADHVTALHVAYAWFTDWQTGLPIGMPIEAGTFLSQIEHYSDTILPDGHRLATGFVEERGPWPVIDVPAFGLWGQTIIGFDARTLNLTGDDMEDFIGFGEVPIVVSNEGLESLQASAGGWSIAVGVDPETTFTAVKIEYYYTPFIQSDSAMPAGGRRYGLPNQKFDPNEGAREQPTPAAADP